MCMYIYMAVGPEAAGTAHVPNRLQGDCLRETLREPYADLRHKRFSTSKRAFAYAEPYASLTRTYAHRVSNRKGAHLSTCHFMFEDKGFWADTLLSMFVYVSGPWVSFSAYQWETT